MSIFEQVYTMTDFYDGPRGGIADFEGRPHVYRSLWLDIEDPIPDVFLLQPVDEEVFRLAIEDWEIWRRWEDAFESGGIGMDSHPSLPSERSHHEEIERHLGDRLVPDPLRSIRARAEFRSFDSPAGMLRNGKSLQVKWIAEKVPNQAPDPNVGAAPRRGSSVTLGKTCASSTSQVAK